MTPTTLTELLDGCFTRFSRADHYGWKEAGAWRTVSTAAVRERAERLAGALRAAGVGAGDRVAIISPTRFEWVLSDYAILSIGAAVVPVYPSLTAEQSAYILRHSGARVALVDGAETWAKLRSVAGDTPALERIVSFSTVDAADGPVSLSGFVDGAARIPLLENGPRPDDLASIIYTSGTTGPPKGVMLTHTNVLSNVLACTEACPFVPNDRQLCFLPLSHIFERMVHYYMLWNGVQIFFAEEIKKVRENLVETRPTILTSVPRVLEKLYGAIEDKARPGPGLTPKLTRFAINTSREWARARWGAPQAGLEKTDRGPRGDATPGLGLRVKHAIADKLVYGKVRALLGGRLRHIVTGGAATPTPLTEFFRGAGMLVLPGYGMTELSPVVAFNTVRSFRFGSVGRPIPGVEVRIAADGEILVRGPNVMRGYFNDEAKTKETIGADGWLLTGDIGELDADGFLYITDRKKDLLVTAGGKNIAPQPIEMLLAQHPLIAQVMLLGDGQPFIAALIVPHRPLVEIWAREQGIAVDDWSTLVAHPHTAGLLQGVVKECCSRLAQFEQVKKIALLDEEFSEANGELTPTLKVRRKVIMARRSDLITSIYG